MKLIEGKLDFRRATLASALHVGNVAVDGGAVDVVVLRVNVANGEALPNLHGFGVQRLIDVADQNRARADGGGRQRGERHEADDSGCDGSPESAHDGNASSS